MSHLAIFIFVLLCLGCKGSDHAPHEMIFDKTKWNTKDGPDYVYRNRMLSDLIDNHKLKGLNRAQLLEFLGDPTRTDSNYLFYRINEQRLKFITLHAKTLVIELAKDSLVDKVMVHE